MENPIRMDDLGIPLFLKPPIWIFYNLSIHHMIYPSLKLSVGKPGKKGAWNTIYVSFLGRGAFRPILDSLLGNRSTISDTKDPGMS